jgi:hypothetical protein
MTTTPADRRYETARAIAAGLPGATARNMPALNFASVTWYPPGGGEVTVWVKHTGGIDVEMHGVSAEAIVAATQAIASMQVTARETVNA